MVCAACELRACCAQLVSFVSCAICDVCLCVCALSSEHVKYSARLRSRCLAIAQANVPGAFANYTRMGSLLSFVFTLLLPMTRSECLRCVFEVIERVQLHDIGLRFLSLNIIRMFQCYRGEKT